MRNPDLIVALDVRDGLPLTEQPSFYHRRHRHVTAGGRRQDVHTKKKGDITGLYSSLRAAAEVLVLESAFVCVKGEGERTKCRFPSHLEQKTSPLFFPPRRARKIPLVLCFPTAKGKRRPDIYPRTLSWCCVCLPGAGWRIAHAGRVREGVPRNHVY